ncbi:nuclear transport factor 2 family protein [Celeribacter persicus]|uniref:nuclear transport factor 2 family protein n=1 Tax=Celeribacter persicus TaxID=1651082 RepID=UPI000D3196E9|nr:nuclear transport factor 2 family protein [Celeribacter persicus]
MSVIEQYIKSWKVRDVEAVLSCLTDDCEIVECYGPVYRGKQTVENWMIKWLETGHVQRWDVTRLWVRKEFEAAQWSFICLFDGMRHEFEGASICDLKAGKIRYLREFTTTAPLYDWHGE